MHLPLWLSKSTFFFPSHNRYTALFMDSATRCIWASCWLLQIVLKWILVFSLGRIMGRYRSYTREFTISCYTTCLLLSSFYRIINFFLNIIPRIINTPTKPSKTVWGKKCVHYASKYGNSVTICQQCSLRSHTHTKKTSICHTAQIQNLPNYVLYFAIT